MNVCKAHSKSKCMINFIGVRKFIWFISGALCIASIFSLFFKGLNFSLEFVGGTQLEIRSEHPISIKEIYHKLEQAQFKNPRVQRYGSTKDFLIRLANVKYFSELDVTKTQEQKIANKVLELLSVEGNKCNLRKVEYIGSEVGEKLLDQGAIAVIISILFTMLYIAFRFEFRLALSAAATLCHNALIVLGCFAVANYEFDLATLAAILAVIGYSLNDTIVIFDRVRENLRKDLSYNVSEIINISINQTLSRTIMTSISTLLVVLSLLLFGGQSLFGFSMALTIGIIIGTYASICMAGNFVLLLGLSKKDFLIQNNN